MSRLRPGWAECDCSQPAATSQLSFVFPSCCLRPHSTVTDTHACPPFLNSPHEASIWLVHSIIPYSDTNCQPAALQQGCERLSSLLRAACRRKHIVYLVWPCVYSLKAKCECKRN